MFSKSQWFHISWQMLHLGVGGILMVVFWIVLARHWSVEQFGNFSYLFTLAALVGIVFDFGMDVALITHLKKQKNIPLNLIFLKNRIIVLSIFFIVGFFSLYHSSSNENMLLALILFLFGGIFLSYTGFANAILRYHDHLHIEAQIGFAQKFVFIVPALGSVMYLGSGITTIAFLYLITHFFAFLVTLFYIQQKKWIYWRKMATPIKTHFYQLLPLFVAALLAVLSLRMDIMLLQWLRGSESVAIYSAASRLFEGFIVMATAFSAIIYPNLVKKTNQPQVLHHYYLRVIKGIALLGILFCLLAVPLAPMLIHWLYPESYQSSGRLLQYLLPALVLVMINMVNAQYLLAIGARHTYMKFLSMALVVQFLVNMVLIPYYDNLAAVTAFWFYQLTLLILYYNHPGSHYS